MRDSIRGRPATADEARAEAVRILGASRLPVIAGLGTDAAGAQAAVRLARACGGVLDHAHGEALLRDLGAVREYGLVAATPAVLRSRADTVLLVGAGLGAYALPPEPTLRPGAVRLVLGFAPPGGKMLAQLGVLRALAAGRPVGEGADPGGEVARLAAALREARYGVAVWGAGTLDEIELEALCGLISDLNAATRWAGLPLPAPANAMGVAQALAWETGFPVRVGFARGRVEHDPWRFDAERLVASGEADAAVWVGALPDTGPPLWGGAVPLVALTAPGGPALVEPPAVEFRVGRPGVEHGAVLYSGDAAGLVAVEAAAPGDLPSVAECLGALAAALEESLGTGGGAPC